jgi:HEAT repeat protein
MLEGNSPELKEAVEAQEVSKEELALATDVMLAIVKTSKGFRMYLPNNPLLVRFVEDFKSKIEKYLSLYGDFRLEIDQFELKCRGKTIYENNEPKESMAFKMHSDGIRYLIFSEGVEEYELCEILEIIGKDRPNDVDDDIVTLLWEKNLPHLTYILTEDFLEFDTAQDGPRTPKSQQEKIRGIYNSISSSPAPPVTPLLVPRNIMILTEEEMEFLRKTRVAEEVRKPLDEVVQILTSILVGEKDPESFSDFLSITAKLTDDLANGGEIIYALGLVRFLGNLAKSDNIHPSNRAGIESALVGILSERTMKVLVRTLDDTDRITPEELLELLHLFGRPSLVRICGMLALVDKMKMRKVIIQVLIDMGRDAPEVFYPYLADQRWFVVRNMLFILTKIGNPAALDHVVQLISHKEPAVRREVFNFLEKFPDGKAKNYLLKFLRDESSAIRIRALQVLASTRSAIALKPIIAIAASEQFVEKDLAEKKMVYEAIGTLGSDQMIPLFREMLMKKYWFNKAKEKELVVCAVSGLIKVQSAAAVKLLEEAHSAKGDELRGIITEALEAISAENLKTVAGP